MIFLTNMSIYLMKLLQTPAPQTDVPAAAPVVGPMVAGATASVSNLTLNFNAV